MRGFKIEPEHSDFFSTQNELAYIVKMRDHYTKIFFLKG